MMRHVNRKQLFMLLFALMLAIASYFIPVQEKMMDKAEYLQSSPPVQPQPLATADKVAFLMQKPLSTSHFLRD